MDHQAVLFDDDMATIGPRRHLSGTVLFHALQGLVAARPTAIVLNPDLVAESSRRDAHATQFLQAQVASVSDMGAAQVVIPILLGGGHYVLAVANFGDRTIHFYDSAPPGRVAAFRVVARIIAPAAAPQQPWRRSYYACVRQQNGSDCGVSVFLNAMHLLCDPAATDLAALPGMPPAGASQITYWLAGRAAILELCRARADVDLPGPGPQLDLIAATLEGEVIARSRRPGLRGTHQHQAVAKVSADLAALIGDDTESLDLAFTQVSYLEGLLANPSG